MTRRLFVTTLLLTLGLTACGSTPGAPSAPSALTFAQEHTQCPSASYDSAVWAPDRGKSPSGASILYDIRVGVTVDIRQMDVNGAHDRLLVAHAQHPQPSPGPGIAGEGMTILYDPPTTLPDDPRSYFTFDVRSGAVREAIKLAYGTAWSPDGRWVVYVSAGRLFKTDMLTGQTVSLTEEAPGGSLDDSPMWSPSGSRIAFWSNRDGAPQIDLIDAEGGPLTPLVVAHDPAPECQSTGGGLFLAGWRPDSKALALFQACAGKQWLRVVTTDGLEVSNWKSTDDQTTNMEWSPDGKRIALESRDSAGRSTVSIAKADGSGLRLVRAPTTSPHWSPDGGRIVFEGVDAAGFAEIFTADADGPAGPGPGSVTPITQNPGAGGLCLH